MHVTLSASRSVFFIFHFSFFIFFGCEKTPTGKIDDTSKPPFLNSASLNIYSINVDTDNSVVVQDSGKKFKITLFANATTNDVDGGTTIASLHYKIIKPNSNDILKEGNLKKISSANDSAAFSDSISFIVKRVEPGMYHFEFSAEDNAHWKSNTMQIPFLVTRNNSTPRIDTVITPDSILIPTSGIKVILFTTTVSDSDGIGDIEQVYFKNLSSSSPSNIDLFDDGETSIHGDQLAGDGIFSRILSIDSNNTSGNKQFRFYAKDKSNALDSVSKVITIYN